MGLGKFFSKSKAKSIEVNGVKYLAPKDGICSLKLEEGKVFVNGEEATKEIIEKSPRPKTSSKKEIHFDELKVVFNGVSGIDGFSKWYTIYYLNGNEKDVYIK